MRVLMINLGYPPNVMGGAELMVQSLARALVEQGMSVAAVSLSQNGSDWQRDDAGVRAYFIDAHPMGLTLLNPRRTRLQRVMWHALGEVNPWTARKLRVIFAQEKPDIVHTHSLVGLSVGAWQAAAEQGLPIIHTLHDYQLLCPRGTMFRRDGPCAAPCFSCRALTLRRKRASRLPATVVGISQFILSAHTRNGYFSGARCSVVPNGFRPTPIDRGRGSDRVPQAPLRIGFLGRLHPIKGVDLLIEVLKGLPPHRYVAMIAGSGSPAYEAQLRAKAQGLALEFLGWVERETFYRQIDVLVVPSVYAEPQGMVLVEAANFGVPVIYSQRGGLEEMGAAFPGFIGFNPDDPNGLRRALASLIDDPTLASSPHPGAGAPIPPGFSFDEFVGGYRRLYEELGSANDAR